MTVKSTISFARNLAMNDKTQENTPSILYQYRRSSLASLKSKKKSMSPPNTAAVIIGLATARSAIPSNLTPT